MPRRCNSSRKVTTVLVSQWRYHGSSKSGEEDEEGGGCAAFAGVAGGILEGGLDLDCDLEEWGEVELAVDLLLLLPLLPLPAWESLLLLPT